MLRFYKKKPEYARLIMFYSNLIIFLCSAGYIGRYYYINHKNTAKQEEVNQKIDDIIESGADVIVDDQGNIADRYGGELRQMYPELVGRVTYYYYNKANKLPVMQAKDNDFWLHRDVDGNPSEPGTPFVDFRCNVKDTLLTIIYAHNMADLSQFGALKMYKTENYWTQHPYVIYETMYEEPCEYQVIAAFLGQVYDIDDTEHFKYYNHFSLNSKEEYDNYVANCKAMSLYDTGISAEYGEKLLVLSTCDSQQKNIPKDRGRFAILCKKTNNKSDESGQFNIDAPTPAPTETIEPTQTVEPTPDVETVAPQSTKKVDNNVQSDEPENKQTTKPAVVNTPKPIINVINTPEPTKEPTPKPEPIQTPESEPEPDPGNNEKNEENDNNHNDGGQ